MARKSIPGRQRHRKGCPGRNCDCPWTGRVRLPDGTMPRVSGDTWAEYEHNYYEMKARTPAPLADRTTTIAQWAERWQASADWRPATQRTRRSSVALHIVPDLGHYAVTELRRDDVKWWVARMRERGTGPVAMRHAVLTLRTMYGVWVKDGRALPRGIPVDAGLIKEKPRKEFAPLTAAQVTALTAAALPDMRLIIEAEAFYGTRVSEILALRAEDVTFTGKDPAAPLAAELARLAALPEAKYEARRPRLRFERKLEVDGTEGEIKNEQRGKRTAPLPQWLAAALAAHLEQWPPVGGWLFTNPRGQGRRGGGNVVKPLGLRRPWNQKGYRERFNEAAARAGITLPRGQATHALRHHCVSVLRDKGWSDQAIGYWIGDAASSVATYYGRPMPDAMDRISAVLSDARTAPPPPLRAVE
jgi:integrase